MFLKIKSHFCLSKVIYLKIKQIIILICKKVSSFNKEIFLKIKIKRGCLFSILPKTKYCDQRNPINDKRIDDCEIKDDISCVSQLSRVFHAIVVGA